MMSKSSISILGSILLSTALASPAAASVGRAPGLRTSLPHYVLFDVGSFGGRISRPSAALLCRPLNKKGALVGIDATAADDPFDPNCFYDCHLDHAFEWKNGGTSDIGALQYGLSSFALGINNRGLAVGLSENGQFDPDTGVWEGRAVAWSKNGKVKDLGTLGGTQSTAAGRRASIFQVRVAVQTSTSDSERSLHRHFTGQLHLVAHDRTGLQGPGLWNQRSVSSGNDHDAWGGVVFEYRTAGYRHPRRSRQCGLRHQRFRPSRRVVLHKLSGGRIGRAGDASLPLG